MHGDPLAHEQLLLLQEHRASLLHMIHMIHAVEVVCLMPGSDRLRLHRLSENLRAHLAEVEAHRRALQAASID